MRVKLTLKDYKLPLILGFLVFLDILSTLPYYIILGPRINEYELNPLGYTPVSFLVSFLLVIVILSLYPFVIKHIPQVKYLLYVAIITRIGYILWNTAGFLAMYV
jgi:hypothetical protein